MEATGTIEQINTDFKNNQTILTLKLNSNEFTSLQKLKDVKVNVEVKKWYKKRSKNANDYCWVLCDEIAKKLSLEGTSITKEDVYKDTILNIGRFQAMILEEKALDTFKKIWNEKGLGYLVQEVCKKDKCVKIHAYYGSSSYDSKEMSLLINNLVELAKELDIETKQQSEIDSLLREWK